MNETALEKVAESAVALKAFQEAPDAPEAVAKLPKLSLADLDRKAKDFKFEVGNLHGAQLLTHTVASNGVAYVDLALEASELPMDDVPLLPLFTSLLFGVGTSEMNRTAFEYEVGAKTGGLSVSTMNSLPYSEDGRVGDLSD